MEEEGEGEGGGGRGGGEEEAREEGEEEGGRGAGGRRQEGRRGRAREAPADQRGWEGKPSEANSRLATIAGESQNSGDRWPLLTWAAGRASDSAVLRALSHTRQSFIVTKAARASAAKAEASADLSEGPPSAGSSKKS